MNVHKPLMGISIALLLSILTLPVMAAAEAPKPPQHHPHVKNAIKEQAQGRLNKKLVGFIKEAGAAQHDILQAIDQLKQKHKSEALKSLAQAGKQLDIVLAREPQLKLARIGGHTEVFDIDGKPESVQETRQAVKKLLDEGKLQEAREILLPLASEIHIYVDDIPLEIYPKEIKRASTEIEKGNLDTAEEILFVALNAIVVEEEIIPLPPIKAEALVDKARTLYREDSKKHHDEIVKLVEQADHDMQFGKALGYAIDPTLVNDVSTLHTQVSAGTADKGQFDKVMSAFGSLKRPAS